MDLVGSLLRLPEVREEAEQRRTAPGEEHGPAPEGAEVGHPVAQLGAEVDCCRGQVVLGAISTVLAALIASPVGLMFDGTTKPLALAMLFMAIVAYALMLYMGRGENRQPAAAE